MNSQADDNETRNITVTFGFDLFIDSITITFNASQLFVAEARALYRLVFKVLFCANIL